MWLMGADKFGIEGKKSEQSKLWGVVAICCTEEEKPP
jgi:hypothetical protein